MARRSPRAETVAARASSAPGAGAAVLVLPDQLTRAVGPLAHMAPGTHEVLLVESREWLSRRPYHVQRVALILAHMRAFAAELAADGHRVCVVRGDASMVELLRARGAGAAGMP